MNYSFFITSHGCYLPLALGLGQLRRGQARQLKAETSEGNTVSSYIDLIEQKRSIISAKQEWSAINAEYAVRMDLQNRFKTGLEIAQYTADIMRRDMAAYDADSSKYTQSLGCWHGFVAQQVMMSVKKHQNPSQEQVKHQSIAYQRIAQQFLPFLDQTRYKLRALSI